MARMGMVATAALAAMLATWCSPALAKTTPKRSFSGSGVATWQYKPSGADQNTAIEAPVSSSGTVTFKEEGGATYEMAIGGPPSFLHRSAEDGFAPPAITVRAEIVSARNAGSGGCGVGAKGSFDLIDDRGDPRTRSVEIRTNFTDCDLGDSYCSCHGGGRQSVDLDFDDSGRRPWSIRFKFSAATEGATAVRPLNIGFTMPRRYTGEPRTTPDEVLPPRGFPVELSVRPCPASGLRLLVSGRRESVSEREQQTCRVSTNLDEGDYTVEAHGKARDGSALTGSRKIRVQDFLIVGLGDSIGSGEGNPDTPRGDGHPARWQDARCHRSADSYQSRTAQALENHDRQTSVTFVHLACSGAAIHEGVSAPYGGIVNPSALAPLDGQIKAAEDLLHNRTSDAVIISVGANDLGFGDVLQFCVKHRPCMDSTYEGGLTLRDWMPARFLAGVPKYAALHDDLRHLVIDRRVYLVQYPDPLRAPGGRAFCDSIINIAGLRAIRADEAEWTFESFLLPLNAAIQNTAPAFDWNVVRGAQDGFAGHGYCAEDEDRWMVQLQESRSRQGDNNGTMHPNRRGHHELSKLTVRELLRDLYVDRDTPRRP
jgi:lysophospholipase L1-like esterase